MRRPTRIRVRQRGGITGVFYDGTGIHTIAAVSPVAPSIIYTWDARKTGTGRIPVKEFLTKQGRFDHLKEEHFAHIQNMVDQMWEEWQIPGVAPLRGILKARI